MRRFFSFLLTVALILTASAVKANPPNQADQYLQMEIMAINTIMVSGNPDKMTIDYAEPGQDPRPATDSSTTYSLSTNGNNKKIVGSLNINMPQYTQLSVALYAPQGAQSAGEQILNTTPKDLVTGISKQKANGLRILYEFSAGIEAEPQNIERMVTLILTGGN